MSAAAYGVSTVVEASTSSYHSDRDGAAGSFTEQQCWDKRWVGAIARIPKSPHQFAKG